MVPSVVLRLRLLRRARGVLPALLARPLRGLVFLLGAAHLAVFLFVVVRRWAWPFELEWMEGGELTHAARVLLGQPIYARPSADFVPFFYTPLYPTALAGLAKLGLPLGFALGRAVSALATVATLAMLVLAGAWEAGPAWGFLAACLYAAQFRFCGAFFDLVRPDAVAMAFVLAAALVARRATRPHHAIVAAALVVAAFFTKQTTAVLAPAIAVALAWRRPKLGVFFAASAAALGVVAVVAENRATSGWFWFYVFEGHQGHRFLWRNFELEYWRDVLMLAPALFLFPVAALSCGRITRWPAAAFAVLLAAAFWQRASTLHYPEHMYYRELWYESPRALVLVPPLAIAAALGGARLASRANQRLRVHLPGYWMILGAAGALASALNHSTQWAYANCFMPVALFGSLLVSLSLRAFVRARPTAGALAAAACALQLVALGYSPGAQIPSAADEHALALFRRRLADLRQPVLAPSHPFLAFAATKRTQLHEMGIGDVAFHGGVPDLSSRLQRGEWPEVVVDENTAVPDLDRWMYVSDRFVYGSDELYPKTGFRVRPLTLWRMQDPFERELAPGITGNFEGGAYRGWRSRGAAFGALPTARAALPKVTGLQGLRAASSRSGTGEGVLASEPFVLDAPRVTMLVAGSPNASVVAYAGDAEIGEVEPDDADRLQPKSLYLGEWVGQRVRLEIVDRDATHAGTTHAGIVVDDVRMSW